MAVAFGKEDGKSCTFRGKDAMKPYGVRDPKSQSAVLEQSNERTDELWAETLGWS